MNYVFFAWLSVILLAIVITPYILNFINRKFLKGKNKGLMNVLKFFRKLHKPAGLLFAIAALVHGYMVLGTIFRIHTGSVLYFSVLFTVILGGIFYKKKKPQLFKAHKALAALTVVLFLLHFLVPGAFS